MVKRFNSYIKEEYTDKTFTDIQGDYKVYYLLYYSFDWDDNILHMPTEIMVLNVDGQEVGMSTQDFAEYRPLIGKEEFDYNGETIVGFANDAFRNFRDQNDPGIFLKDTKKALANNMKAKAWNDFIECLTTGTLFAIITARGHEPATIREGIEYIISGFNPEQRASMIDHLKMFAYLFDQKLNSEEELIKKYLDTCEYIGVSAPSRGGTPDNPEKAKEDAFLAFVDKCNKYAKTLEDNFNSDPETVQKGERWKVIAKIGFSDDDARNVKHLEDVVKELHNEVYSNVKEFYVKDTGKEKVMKSIFHKYESKIIKFKQFINETSHQTPGLESSVLSATQLQTGRLNQSGPLNTKDPFFHQFRGQVEHLAKLSKDVKKEIKKKKS